VGKAPEFVEKKFRRSKSLHTKRYYDGGIRRFRQYAAEKAITEVDDENVYDVPQRVRPVAGRPGNQAQTLTGYVHTTKKFLLFLDVRIGAQRFGEKVEQPRILKIEAEPLSMEILRKVVSLGRPNIFALLVI